MQYNQVNPVTVGSKITDLQVANIHYEGFAMPERAISDLEDIAQMFVLVYHCYL